VGYSLLFRFDNSRFSNNRAGWCSTTSPSCYLAG